MTRKGLRLRITIGGRWYLALTVVLGVVALTSGNNVLYLLESFLFSALIGFGILSERTLYSAEVSIHRQPAIAGKPVNDTIKVRNKSRFPIFCFEVGEWKNNRFNKLAVVPYLGGRSDGNFPSEQIISNRGIHSWDYLAIATTFPVGFAQKIYLLGEPGNRIVWPEKRAIRLHNINDLRDSDRKFRYQGSSDIAEGEVRIMTYEDDLRWVIWTLTAKTKEKYVRNRQKASHSSDLILDLRKYIGANLEKEIVRIASHFYNLNSENSDLDSLRVIDQQGSKVLTGPTKVLNFLATVESSETIG